MAKKKSKWLSPKKQRALEEKQRQDKNKRIAMLSLLGVAVAVAIGILVVGIVLATRPYYASIEIEGYGTIKIKLHDDEAPKTVEHFVELAASGFYDGTTFNKVIQENMICGGHKENGEAPPAVEGEFLENNVNNNHFHARGTISLLRNTKADNSDDSEYSDYYNTATNEFFIMQRDNWELDPYYAAFGTVIEGMDIVDRICNEVKVENDDGFVLKDNRPVIKTITISRER